jgi:hypothetical protein
MKELIIILQTSLFLFYFDQEGDCILASSRGVGQRVHSIPGSDAFWLIFFFTQYPYFPTEANHSTNFVDLIWCGASNADFMPSLQGSLLPKSGGWKVFRSQERDLASTTNMPYSRNLKKGNMPLTLTHLSFFWFGSFLLT